MLISHIYKFVYVKAEKVASTSTEALLEKYCLIPEIMSHHKIKPYADEIISDYGIVGKRRWGKPSSGVWFNHKTPNGIKRDFPNDNWEEYTKVTNIRNPYDMTVSFYSTVYRGIFDKNKFQEFLEVEGEKLLHHKNYIFWTIDNEFCLDYYIRYEHLEEDIQNFLKMKGIPDEGHKLPHYDNSQRPHYREIYNEQTKKIVYRMFEEVFEKFKYEF